MMYVFDGDKNYLFLQVKIQHLEPYLRATKSNEDVALNFIAFTYYPL